MEQHLLRAQGPKAASPTNVNTTSARADVLVSLDQLQAGLPETKHVSVITSWFGTDLRAGVCEFRPGVDRASKPTRPVTWSVSGAEREQALLVSDNGGRPAYGGTPSDRTLIELIGELKQRGLAVTLTPFILMDVPDGNQLPDPYSNNASQPAYPWRGRITVDPAPGVVGSPDQTGAAAEQVAALVGTATPGDFTVEGGQVDYLGPDEWSLRRQVLHYAHLSVAAGGIDTFVIGSELRGLTQVRSSADEFPSSRPW